MENNNNLKFIKLTKNVSIFVNSMTGIQFQDEYIDLYLNNGVVLTLVLNKKEDFEKISTSFNSFIRSKEQELNLVDFNLTIEIDTVQNIINTQQ